MKKRLIIYFNYHPNGQADAACRFAVQQMAAVGQVFFVNNGPLQPESRQWAQGCCHTVLERENTGFDVGAYRDAVLQTGLDMLLQYDEVVLMNYTLAGPVGADTNLATVPVTNGILLSVHLIYLVRKMNLMEQKKR